jgi:hypothetical protein
MSELYHRVVALKLWLLEELDETIFWSALCESLLAYLAYLYNKFGEKI